jgi:muconolactone delta-isomerase
MPKENSLAETWKKVKEAKRIWRKARGEQKKTYGIFSTREEWEVYEDLTKKAKRAWKKYREAWKKWEEIKTRT